MSLKRHVVRQFAKPSGLPGRAAGRIMARRSSNRVRNARTVEMMELTADMQVLEIGCGPGLALEACAETIRVGRVVGLDHSDVMVGQARARLAGAGLLDRVELVTGDVDALIGLEREFDRVFSINVIQFVPDKAGFFGKLHTLLASGGKTFTTYQPRLEADAEAAAAKQAGQIANAMRTAGFTNIENRPIDAGRTKAICVVGHKSGW